MAVYAVLLVYLRLTGKRSLGEMSAFDIVVLIVVDGSLRTAVIGRDSSFCGPLIAVAAMLLLDKGIGWLGARRPAFSRRVEGAPAPLARHGRRHGAALRRHAITRRCSNGNGASPASRATTRWPRSGWSRKASPA